VTRRIASRPATRVTRRFRGGVRAGRPRPRARCGSSCRSRCAGQFRDQDIRAGDDLGLERRASSIEAHRAHRTQVREAEGAPKVPPSLFGTHAAPGSDHFVHPRPETRGRALTARIDGAGRQRPIRRIDGGASNPALGEFKVVTSWSPRPRTRTASAVTSGRCHRPETACAPSCALPPARNADRVHLAQQ